MFDDNDDDWNINDDYLKDIDFDKDIECNINKNPAQQKQQPKTNSPIIEPFSSKEIITTKTTEIKTKTQVLKDDWNLDDEDYFKDFDVDEVLESLSNKNSQTQQTSVLKGNSQILESNSTNKFNDNIFESFTSEVESHRVNKTSHKNVILDIFKNSNSSSEDKTNPIDTYEKQKRPATVANTSEFQNNSNDKTESIKVSEVPSNKRKKNVAFSESVSDKSPVKRYCVPSTSRESIFNISNVNDSKKKSLLEWLESPARENVRAQKLKQAVIRKFPGPAGILPDDADENEVIDLDSFDENKNNKSSYSDVCSQNTKNSFTSGAWQLMIDDLPADFQLYDISVVRENALEFSKTYKKVPYLAGIIQNIDHKPNDPHVVLKDLSGKIDARIHHSICKLYPNALGTNVVMLLKDVGVIVTSKKYVYVIISPKSLVSAYSDDARLIKTPHLEKLLDKNCDVDLLLEQ